MMRPLRAQHAFGSRFGHQERALQVYVRYRLKIFFLQPEDQVVPGDAGIIDEHVQLFKSLERFLQAAFAVGALLTSAASARVLALFPAPARFPRRRLRRLRRSRRSRPRWRPRRRRLWLCRSRCRAAPVISAVFPFKSFHFNLRRRSSLRLSGPSRFPCVS